ncbi:MAG: hypothetical protein ACPGQR_07535, partial [Marinirhabdus sp.]
MSQTPAALPQNDFYRSSTFFTLGGASGAVWMVCLVIANLDPGSEFLTPKTFRFIAVGLSLAIAVMMLLRKKIKKKAEHWMLAFFNGLLIFVNASGLNAISSKVSFENGAPVKEKPLDNGALKAASFVLQGFFPFKNEVSWWDNNEVYKENRNLRAQNEKLQQKVASFQKNTQNPTPPAMDGAQRYNSIIDSLTEQLQRATQQQTGQPETTDDAETLRAMLERCQGQLKKINRQMVENKRGTAILLREKEAEIT